MTADERGPESIEPHEPHAHGIPAGAGESSLSGPWTWRKLSALPLLLLVRAYQLVLSPLSPPCCRFYPSCSAYAVTALVRFGPVRGGWLAVRRLGRCHPWNPGGVDHVPPARAHAPVRSHTPSRLDTSAPVGADR